MLISHYAALSGQTKTVTGMVGTVDQECDLTTVARSINFKQGEGLCICMSRLQALPNSAKVL